MLKSFRIKEWVVSHYMFTLSILFLLLYFFNISFNVALKKTAFILIVFPFLASFGYLLNDVFDIKQDLLANKKNFAAKRKMGWNILLLFLFFLCALITWYSLSRSLLVLYLILLQLLLLLLYSIPIARLKEKPIIGLIIDSLYAYANPLIVVFFTVSELNLSNYPIFIILFFWSFIIGLRSILKHQTIDFHNDLKSKTRTFATTKGLKKTQILEKIYLAPFEFIFFLIFLYTINFTFVVIYIVYLFFITLRISPFKKIKESNFIYPKLNLVNHYLAQFYNKWVPIIAIVFLIYLDFKFSFFLLIFLVLSFTILKTYIVDFIFINDGIKNSSVGFFNFLKYKLVYNLYYKIISPFYYNTINPLYFKVIVPFFFKIIVPSYYKIKGVLSFIVNHVIYYVFLLFGRNLKEENAAENEKIIPTSHSPKKETSEKVKKEIYSINKTIEEKETLKISENILDIAIEKNVHALWIGKILSNMELLTIQSFIENGYTFHLWVYEQIETPLPKEILLKDANEIIAKSRIFSYKNQSQFGGGKGSVAGFSDIFRYKLLYEKGGWWVDMDVTCLKPFDVKSDYFFRAHQHLDLVGNVMKTPKNSPLMKACFEQAILSIDENNTDWHKPIDILISNVKKFKLEEYVFEHVSNTDEFNKLEPYYFGDDKLPNNWHFIHWCNEVLRSTMIDKNQYLYLSTFALLLRKFNVSNVLNEHEIIQNDKAFHKELLTCNLLQIL